MLACSRALSPSTVGAIIGTVPFAGWSGPFALPSLLGDAPILDVGRWGGGPDGWPTTKTRTITATTATAAMSTGRLRGGPGKGASTNKTVSGTSATAPSFWASRIRCCTRCSGR